MTTPPLALVVRRRELDTLGQWAFHVRTPDYPDGYLCTMPEKFCLALALTVPEAEERACMQMTLAVWTACSTNARSEAVIRRTPRDDRLTRRDILLICIVETAWIAILAYGWYLLVH